MALPGLVALLISLGYPAQPVAVDLRSPDLLSLPGHDWQHGFNASCTSRYTFPVLSTYRDSLAVVRRQFHIMALELPSDDKTQRLLEEITNTLFRLEVAYDKAIEKDAALAPHDLYRWHDGASTLRSLVYEDVRQEEKSSMVSRLWNRAVGSRPRAHIRAKTVHNFVTGFCDSRPGVSRLGKEFKSALDHAYSVHADMETQLSALRALLVSQGFDILQSSIDMGQARKQLEAIWGERARIEEGFLWNCGQGNTLKKRMVKLKKQHSPSKVCGKVIPYWEVKGKTKGIDNDDVEDFIKQVESGIRDVEAH